MGGRGGQSPADLATVVPGGGLPFWLPADLAFSFASAPIPPTPFPSGEGGDLKFSYARGFAPCIPGLNPGGTGFSCGKRVPAELRPLRGGVGVALRCPTGGAGGWSPADLALPEPGGGLPFWLPAYLLL